MLGLATVDRARSHSEDAGVSQPAPRQRNVLSLRTAVAVWKYHLLAAAICMILACVFDTTIVRGAFGRLGWWLGPWSSLPYPRSTDPPDSDLDSLMPVVLFTGMLSLYVGVIHGACLLVVAGSHAWFGWPSYWRTVRRRIDLNSVWAESVQRSWWVWPVGQGIWCLLRLGASCLWYVKYPAADQSLLFAAANLAGICVIYGVVANGILHAAICRAVARDDRLCVGCGYALRGLPSARCPECGRLADFDAAPEYAILRRWAWRRTRASSGLLVAVVLLMFLVPVWMPLGLATVPARWVPLLPDVVRSKRATFEYDRNSFPVRFDATCVVRKNRALAVCRFTGTHPSAGEWLVGYWSDENGMRRGRSPDSLSAGRFHSLAAPDVIAGPWRLSLCVTEKGFLWLNRADGTYSIEVYGPRLLPEDLRRLDEQGVWAAASASLPAASQAAGSAPSSRPQGSAVTASKPGE